jgi:hypothetical protein
MKSPVVKKIILSSEDQRNYSNLSITDPVETGNISFFSQRKDLICVRIFRSGENHFLNYELYIMFKHISSRRITTPYTLCQKNPTFSRDNPL